jgi:hypothetical protein
MQQSAKRRKVSFDEILPADSFKKEKAENARAVYSWMTFSYLLRVKSAFPRVSFVAEREKTYYSEQKPSQCSLQSRGWRAQGEWTCAQEIAIDQSLSLSHSGSEIASDRPTDST